jgi:competence protein ComEA
MQKRNCSSDAGGFVLLFLLLLLTFLGGAMKRAYPEGLQSGGKVFVQASGHVKTPGVYGFQRIPSVAELVDRAGGLTGRGPREIPEDVVPLKSGDKVNVKWFLKQVTLAFQKISPFHRLTLGIPISINNETAPGLAAVPGIGPKRAAAIVSARERNGGFKKLKDLLSVPGISASLYSKISPYLTL